MSDSRHRGRIVLITGGARGAGRRIAGAFAAVEADGRVIFLYAVRPGAADRAYGIQVARLAGLPPWVADRAEAVLSAMAETRPRDEPSPGAALPPAMEQTDRLIAEGPAAPYQMALDGFVAASGAGERLARELKELDLGAMTPREAIDWLFERQERL